MNSKKYTVTSALPYANGPLHIGHIAGAYLPADIYVRYRRLKKDDWRNMLQTLINNMPDGGVIKLHASFISNQDSKNKIYSIFNDITPEYISICDDKAIVELEMLFEKKILIGSLTSLERYAKAFESEFNNVSLY